MNLRGRSHSHSPKQYQVQLLDQDGRAKATGYFDAVDEELILDDVRVDPRVMRAAMALPDGQGDYVDDEGRSTKPF